MKKFKSQYNITDWRYWQNSNSNNRYSFEISTIGSEVNEVLFYK